MYNKIIISAFERQVFIYGMLLIINVTKHTLHNRVSGTISHVTLNTINIVLCLPFTNVSFQS